MYFFALLGVSSHSGTRNAKLQKHLSTHIQLLNNAGTSFAWYLVKRTKHYLNRDMDNTNHKLKFAFYYIKS
jgi:predicted secreted protein